MNENYFIDPNGNFEPSKDAKNLWLKTRKSELEFGKLKLPGFFITSNFVNDKRLFWLAVMAELYGLYVLYNLLPQPLFALLFFVVDFILAFFSHILKGKLCLAINKKKLAENGDSFTPNKTSTWELDKQSSKIIKIKLYEFIFYFLIIVLAIVKIKSFLDYSSQVVIAQKAFIWIVYIFCAYVHIKHTGFYIHEILFRFKIKKERKDLLNTPTNIEHLQRVEICRPFELPNNLSYRPAQVDKSYIDCERKILYSWGILQDNTMAQIISSQDKEIQEKLALELRKHQLDILQQATYRVNI